MRGVPWHLPGLPGRDGRETEAGRTAAGASFRVPALSREDAEAVADEVRAAALEGRGRLATARVIEAAAAAAGRVADPSDPAGREAASTLSEELGWPSALAEETLSGMGRSWTEDALHRVVERELGGTAVLDGWTDEGAILPGRRRRASGPPLLFVVHAGNVPGVAVTAAIRGLLVRSGVLSRAPGSEPGLLACFARALTAEEPALGRSLATTWWPADGGEAAWDTWVKRAGKVVVYGGEEAVRGVRGRVPGDEDLVAYGPRLGVAVALPDASAGEAASALAADVCAYEQQGCVSPRLAYAVGSDPLELGRRLAEALEEEVARLPRPQPDEATAVAIRSARAEAEFAGLAGRDVHVLGGEGLAWTVVVGGEDPLLTLGLPRLVRVHGAAGVEELGRTLGPLEGRVQTVGYAGREGLPALADLAARLGACRIAPLGEVAWPPADWLHDGRPQLLPLLRWTEWE